MIIHGMPRSTLDMDIYIPAKGAAVDKIFEIASSLGLKTEHGDIKKISNDPNLISGQWICFAKEEQEILDIYLASDKEFDRLFANSEVKKDKSLAVRVASLKDIEKMKKKAGRPIDLADIAFIKEFRDNALDK
ncbi:MAG: hypothetical protein KKD07_10090 [Candidatus Omnitrophica bacterium]|nr:hypothetical protein [Candidatus Omnitrophota bacterium]MBU1997721.1 hypothetical protein [Candidatus Omnitrophota bacterium]MBU4334777.1 hypothetical protein [Candidatus Omnitrophota bacterium]